MKIVHSGFDKLEVSFQGALPSDAIDTLEWAKEEALKEQRPIPVSLKGLDMHVEGHGMRGGYAFITDTGSLGETWAFKKNIDPQQWNIAAFVHAANLLVYGYEECRDRLWQRLEQMDCLVISESVRRVDYAMDFLAPGFEPQLSQFVAHGHCKVSPYWEEPGSKGEKSSAVFRGRQLETVTIGKMPGRQVTLYNKRKAAIEQRTPHWFKVWGIDRKDPDAVVWRVEVRAGKKELKDKYRITTFQDVEDSIGDVFLHTVKQVRFLDGAQSDSNISRQRLHPIWRAATEHLENSLFEFRAGLLPGQYKEIERKMAIDNYMRQITGNAAGLAVAMDLSNEEIEQILARRIEERIDDAIGDSSGKFAASVRRARERLRFVAPR